MTGRNVLGHHRAGWTWRANQLLPGCIGSSGDDDGQCGLPSAKSSPSASARYWLRRDSPARRRQSEAATPSHRAYSASARSVARVAPAAMAPAHRDAFKRFGGFRFDHAHVLVLGEVSRPSAIKSRRLRLQRCGWSPQTKQTRGRILPTPTITGMTGCKGNRHQHAGCVAKRSVRSGAAAPQSESSTTSSCSSVAVWISSTVAARSTWLVTVNPPSRLGGQKHKESGRNRLPPAGDNVVGDGLHQRHVGRQRGAQTTVQRRQFGSEIARVQWPSIAEAAPDVGACGHCSERRVG